VEVVTDGEVVGKGIVSLSAADLARVKGMKTPELRELLPRADEEAVHRDRFVLT
jgi:glutamate 5-kinase